MNKSGLIKEIIHVLNNEKNEAETRLESARQAVIDAPGAMQSYSDTTRYQVGRLADEIAKSVREKEEAIRALDYFLTSFVDRHSESVAVGSLVQTEDEAGLRTWNFILGKAGGLEFTYQNEKCRVVSPTAPVAVALIGKKKGEITEIRSGSVAKKLTVLDVS